MQPCFTDYVYYTQSIENLLLTYFPTYFLLISKKKKINIKKKKKRVYREGNKKTKLEKQENGIKTHQNGKKSSSRA